jgi:hypothetical protein
VGTDVSAPTTPTAAFVGRGTRGLRFGTTAWATLQPRDFSTNTPAAVYVRTGATWAAAPNTPPGALATDGAKLYSVYVDNGLKVATWDAPTGTWGTATPNVASTDSFFTDGGTPSTVGAFFPPGSNGCTYVGGKVSASNDVRIFQLSTPPTGWVSNGVWTNTVDHRLITASFWGWHFYSTPAGALSWNLFGGANNGGTQFSSGVTGFDALARGNHVWYAASVNGVLLMRMQVVGTGQWFVVPGPGGVDGFNNSLTCRADSPEFSMLYDKIGLSWSEQCGAGPWRMYFRLLN